MPVPKKRVSKSKKNIRKNAWKKKVEPQAVRSIFLAKYLLRNKPDDPALEKLLIVFEMNSLKRLRKANSQRSPS
jgi:ribosomal protein L32